jgi:hypothetical protein
MSYCIHMRIPAVVLAPVEIAGARLSVTLAYKPEDPLAVTLTFTPSLGGDYEWVTCRTVARDLLSGGLETMSGTGDVTAWAGINARDRYYLRIRGRTRSTILSLETSWVEGFLAKTYRSIPCDLHRRCHRMAVRPQETPAQPPPPGRLVG